MRCFLVLVWICSTSRVIGFGVHIEGLIDLGPKWSYKYKLSPLSTTEIFIEPPVFSYSQKVRKDNEPANVSIRNGKDQIIPLTDNLNIEENNDSLNNLSTATDISNLKNMRTKKNVSEKSDQMHHLRISDKNHKNEKKIETYIYETSDESDKNSYGEVSKNIKRNGNINDKLHDFTIHVYKQSIKVWDNMIKITNSDKIKRKIRIMKNNFIQKFNDFMEQSKKHIVKTKLGTQKYILNTIDTSNMIMKRLVNYLSTYEKSINSRYKSVSIFQREVDKEKRLEYVHACKKFRVCRTNDDFSDYLIELINIILQTDNSKIKQAADALTEVVKTNDFTQTIDSSTQDKLLKHMTNIELWDPFVVKAMFVILRNVLSHKNHPIVIMDAIDQEVANKTVAFHEILDIMNKNIYQYNINTTNWNEIKKQLEDWRDGKGKDVQNVFNSLINVIKKGLEKIDKKTAQEIDTNMNIILKPLSKIFGR